MITMDRDGCEVSSSESWIAAVLHDKSGISEV